MKKYGKKRVPGCYCTYNFTCGACLRSSLIFLQKFDKRRILCYNGCVNWNCVKAIPRPANSWWKLGSGSNERGV